MDEGIEFSRHLQKNLELADLIVNKMEIFDELGILNQMINEINEATFFLESIIYRQEELHKDSTFTTISEEAITTYGNELWAYLIRENT